MSENTGRTEPVKFIGWVADGSDGRKYGWVGVREIESPKLEAKLLPYRFFAHSVDDTIRRLAGGPGGKDFKLSNFTVVVDDHDEWLEVSRNAYYCQRSGRQCRLVEHADAYVICDDGKAYNCLGGVDETTPPWDVPASELRLIASLRPHEFDQLMQLEPCALRL